MTQMEISKKTNKYIITIKIHIINHEPKKYYKYKYKG